MERTCQNCRTPVRGCTLSSGSCESSLRPRSGFPGPANLVGREDSPQPSKRGRGVTVLAERSTSSAGQFSRPPTDCLCETEHPDGTMSIGE